LTVEVIGIDHIFVAARDLRSSEEFYDRVMGVLGFRKGEGTIGGDPHRFYFNRHFVYALRPARDGTPDHDPYAPGTHHLCFRVVDEAAVDRAARELREAGVEVREPRYYPEYGPDYYATFFEDPNGIRLEIMNFRELRRKLMYDWETRAGL
jgi:glyoxylase I family protein